MIHPCAAALLQRCLADSDPIMMATRIIILPLLQGAQGSHMGPSFSLSQQPSEVGR